MKYSTIIIYLLFSNNIFAQSIFMVIVKSENDTLMGATANIRALQKSVVANQKGEIVVTNIPNGKFEIEFRHIGYETEVKGFVFPLSNPDEVLRLP